MRGGEQAHEFLVDLAPPFEVGQRRALPCSRNGIRALFAEFRAPRGGPVGFWQLLDPREDVGAVGFEAGFWRGKAGHDWFKGKAGGGGWVMDLVRCEK